MFGPSLKSVPGCLVSIVPMLIGVPVAFTPGLGPHFEVSVEALVLEPLDDELELLPHPAARIATPRTAASAISRRVRGTYSNNLTDLSSSSDPGMNPPR